VLVISDRDNVATALESLTPGQIVVLARQSVVVAERIPPGHKIALCRIAVGEPVVKYGSPIGRASAEIPLGAHVHTHNVASGRGRGDLTRPDPAVPQFAEPDSSPSLSGTRRD